MLIIDEPWLEINHNCPDFEELYAKLLNDTIEIVDSPFDVTSNVLNIIDNE